MVRFSAVLFASLTVSVALEDVGEAGVILRANLTNDQEFV